MSSKAERRKGMGAGEEHRVVGWSGVDPSEARGVDLMEQIEIVSGPGMDCPIVGICYWREMKGESISTGAVEGGAVRYLWHVRTSNNR
jgi:hypothetical protein